MARSRGIDPPGGRTGSRKVNRVNLSVLGLEDRILLADRAMTLPTRNKRLLCVGHTNPSIWMNSRTKGRLPSRSVTLIGSARAPVGDALLAGGRLRGSSTPGPLQLHLAPTHW